MFDWLKETKHLAKCEITVPYNGTKTFRIVKTVWVRQTKQNFDFKIGKDAYTKNLKLEYAVYSKKNNPILYYDIDKPDPINIQNIQTGKDNSKLYHTLFRSKITNEVLNHIDNKMIFIIIGLCVIAVIGVGLYGQYELSLANDKIAELTTKMISLYANSTKTGGIVIK
jgi:hypothetical protein